MNKILLLLITSFFVTHTALAKEAFVLTEIEKVDGGKSYVYKTNGPVTVKYYYGPLFANIAFFIELNKHDTSIKHLLSNAFYVDNFESNLIKGSQMSKHDELSKDNFDRNCSYVGKAEVFLSDLWLYEPDFPSEYEGHATISKILVASSPKLEC